MNQRPPAPEPASSRTRNLQYDIDRLKYLSAASSSRKVIITAEKEKRRLVSALSFLPSFPAGS